MPISLKGAGTMSLLRSTKISYCLLVVFMFGAVSAVSVEAQTLEQRMRHYREKQREAAARELASQRALAKRVNRVSISEALRMQLPAVSLDNVALEDAFRWVQDVSGVRIVMNWRNLEAMGVNPQRGVSVSGAGLTVEQILKVLILELGSDVDMLMESTPWYVRIMTKDEANRNPVVRVYGIGDLIQRIPNFEDAPKFNLAEITAASQGGGNSVNIFDEAEEEENEPSKLERAEDIARLVRETIEPEIWRENGGTVGSVSVWRDMLVIRAPEYVQRQIGISAPMMSSPVVGPQMPRGFAGSVSRGGRYVTMNMRVDAGMLRTPMRRVGGISGVVPRSRPISGVIGR